MSETSEVQISTGEMVSYIEAAKSVTQVMMQSLDAESGDPVKGKPADFDYEVKSQIHLFCRAPRTLTIMFEKGTGEKMAQRLFYTEDELEEEDVHDAIGELANMVAGNAKSVLADVLQEHIGLGLPLVAWSADQGVSPFEGDDDSVFIPFETKIGKFAILVSRGLNAPD